MNSKAQVNEFFAHERAMQPFMDRNYEARGHVVRSREGNRRYDLILIVRQQEQFIEEKYRSQARKDVLVELIQDVVSGAPGWYYSTGCDFLHYIFCPEWQPPTHYWRIAWHSFKTWMATEFLKTKPRFSTSLIGYGLTLNVSVPYIAIPGAMKQEIAVTEAEAVP